MRAGLRWRVLPLLIGMAGLLVARGARSQAGANTFLYLHDNGTPNQVHGFFVAGDGTLTELGGSPVSTGNMDGGANGQVASMAYSSNRSLLFASGGSGISAFHVNVTGTLDPVTGSPFAGRNGLVGGWGVAVVDQGTATYVYASDRLRNRLVGFSVQPDGTLTELSTSPFATGAHPDGMSAVGNLVAVADGGEGGVSTFVSLSNGALKASAKRPVHVGASDLYEAFLDPLGKFLYVPDDGSVDNRVFAFGVAKTGKLKKVAKSPFKTSGPLTTTGMAVGTKFLYTLGDGHPDIQIMARSTKGALTNVGTVDSGTNFAAALVLDPTGHVLAVASDEGDKIATFTVNATTGALTPAFNADLATTNVGQLLFVQR